MEANVIDSGREPPRIYWMQNNGGARDLVSVLEDLSDYRIDHDGSATGGFFAQNFIIGRNVN